MDMMLNIDLKKLVPPISYRDKIMLVGSCFTEHIGNALGDLKFSILQNPNGILFGPDAVCKSLLSYAENKKYTEADMFQLNEVWNSWQHHSRFSNLSSGEAIRIINESQQQAHDFLQEADWLIITLGSSFTYRLTQQAATAKHAIGDTVANCHRAPANWFTKEMLEVEDIKLMLEDCLKRLKEFNPKLKFIFTVSPVRHIRDGVVENNRSKARLIESVHYIDAKFESAYYFPAYELVIDVLRDYRFYDIDLVHPNYPATEFVLEKFAESCIDENTQQLMQEVKKIIIARKHKPFQPETKAHLQFLITHFEKAKLLQEKYSFLDLKEELVYFSQI
ncbi:MAG: GSCFA domain-containing protein [Chitinophagaceae bacterium]|nr:GSCFA domain-containing protein [Chitinophagaceae bacterium]MBK9938064.1 GSCFA domain-containing protein [Chitinophagaceae bacterium]HQW43942.1 GSCFA domain-containing protein [Chitinophagaceae bacterium]